MPFCQLLIPSSPALTWMTKFPDMAQVITEKRLGGLQDQPRFEQEPILGGVEFEGFPRHGKHLVPHARKPPMESTT